MIKKYLSKLLKSNLIKNVAIVIFGTAFAQLINMLFSPIITRLYGPEIFGTLGTFLAITSIITPLVALTYPTAIVLPKENKEAVSLVQLSMILAIIFSIICTVILMFTNEWFINLLNLKVPADYLYIFSIVIVFSACQQILKQWFIREKRFKVIAKVEILNSLITNLIKVFVGLILPTALVLITITTFSYLSYTLMLILFSSLLLYNFRNISKSSIKKVALQYDDFPKLRSPQVLLNSFSNNLPVLLLTTLFGPAAAGFYTLSRTVLNVPVRVISSSIGEVLYPKLSEAAKNKEDIKGILIKSSLLLSLIGIVPFSVIIALGPSIFSFVFGDEWYLAGEYARWLSVWLFFMFINRPAVVAIPILKIQGKFLMYEIVTMLIKVISITTGYLIFKDEIAAIAFFSVSGSISYLWLIIWVIKLSGKYNSRF